jgi:hypothetical protein
MTQASFLELFSQCRRPTAKHDTYYAVYDELFAPYANKDITFVEVGISGGGSLEAWKKFLGKGARVIGIDLNPALRDVLNGEGFEVVVGDQSDPEFWRSFYARVGNIDVLLDDGGHTNAQQWCTLKHSIKHINDGGLLVIEDTHASYMSSFGNPSRDSFISRVVQLVDEMNYRSSSIDGGDRRLRPKNQLDLLRDMGIDQLVHSVRFYESIVALSIDSTKCVRSHKSNFGSTENLPGGAIPEDYRFKGIKDALPVRLKRRVRRVLQRLTQRAW